MTTDPKLKGSRHSERGSSEGAVINAILDAGSICHVGFEDEGWPYVIPTIYVRMQDRVYIHGATGNRMMGLLRRGHPTCLTVTLVDGLVLAKSLFSHSMNYRSVMIFAKGEEVKDLDSKNEILLKLSEQLIPGRVEDSRHPTKSELKQTGVFEIGRAHV